MTSTSFNIGLSDDTRLSSRVLRPPGGGHTDIFGGEPEPPRTGRRMVPNIAAAAEEPAKPTSTGTPEQNGQANSAVPPTELVAAATLPPQPADNRSLVTSEHAKIEPAKPSSEPPKPARVRVPPGGFSSGLW